MALFRKLPELKIHILWRPVLFFLLFLTIIILFGIFYYRTQKIKIIHEEQRDLSAITTLKIEQIVQWRKERLENAAAIRDNAPLVRSISDLFNNSSSPVPNSDIQNWMISECNNFQYSGISLIDTNKNVRMTFLLKGLSGADIPTIQLADVIKNKKVVITDLIKNDSGYVYMNLLIPLVNPDGKHESAFGVMILQIDPGKVLFPLIESWPLQSKSSETLILRKEGDSILFLNRLKFQAHGPLNFRLSTGNASLLASKAVSGFKGVTEGVDYRNIPVVGYVTEVPGFPWYMVAKTDKEELDEPLKITLRIVLLISLLLIIINISLFGLWIRNLKVRMYRLELKNELDSKLMKETLQKNEERLTTTLNHLLEGCQIIGTDWRYLYLNDAADVHNRRPKEELLGKTYMESWPGIEYTEVFHVIKTCMDQWSYQHLENMFVFPDGSTGWFDLIIQPVPEGVFILSIDITVRKLAEKAIQESEERFRNIFNSLIEGFCVIEMVFDNMQKPIDYRFIEINTSFEMQTGLKNAKGKLMSELAPDNEEVYWYEIYGKVALTGESVSFENEAKALNRWFEVRASRVEAPEIKQVAIYFNDITERKRGEKALKISEERFRSLYENMTIGIYRTTIDGQILMANPAMVRMLGFDSFEQLTQRNLEMEGYEPGYPRTKFIETMENEGRITGLESAWRKRNGDPVFVRENARAIRNAQGKILYFDGTVEDITERKKMEEALLESEDKFKYIFDHSMLGKSITLPTGELQVNDAFCQILGYNREELSKLTWKDFTHPDDFEITENVIRAHLSGETNSTRFDKRYIKKDGTVIWTDVSTSLRHDNYGKPLYFMTTVNDITELKLAEEVLRNEEKRLRILLESLPQLFWTCEPDGPCDYLSRQWIDYTGIPEADQLGYGWLEQIHPDDRARTVSEWNEKVKSGESFDVEFRIRRNDGVYHWFQTRAVPIRNIDARIIRWLVSNTDIDTIRKAEIQIKNYNKDLEMRVVQRTEQLAAANKELEAFSYSVSHDLRAPLRSVHGYTNILLEEYNALLDAEGKRICGIISKSATQMGELIDDLLSFSRIGRSNLNPLLLDMNSIVSTVTNELRTANRENINFRIKKLHNSYGDSNLIKQVWINLISNAIKYSSKKEKSEVVIQSTKKDDKIVYLIRDNGVGFDMQYIDKLFGVFQRLHSGSEFEGNGVGLAIVQRIILRHGGSVWAESEPGNGAVFYFSLPAILTVNNDV